MKFVGGEGWQNIPTRHSLPGDCATQIVSFLGLTTLPQKSQVTEKNGFGASHIDWFNCIEQKLSGVER